MVKTKLSQILKNRVLSQRDLQRMIYEKHDVYIGDDRISNMVNGKTTNMQLKTALIVADTLGVTIDEIIEHKKLI